MSQQLLIIDALNLIRRFYAVNAKQPLEPKQILIATIAQTRNALAKLTGQFNPSHIVAVFDSGQPDWRQHLDPTYKANRSEMPEPLKQALPAIQDELLDDGIDSLYNPHIQADDLVATLACKATQHHLSAMVVSTDQGYWQLLDRPGLSIYDYFKKIFITPQQAYQKFQLNCSQLVDFWAMTGSSGVNLKGVPGIGPKSAQQLLSHYQTLENILSQAAPDDKLAQKVCEHADVARQTAQLMQLQTQLPLGFKLSQIRYRQPQTNHS